MLWIGGVSYVTWRDFPEEDWGLSDPIVGEAPSETEERRSAILAKLAEERRSAIWHASRLAVLPPAFVLALGSALVWAFRGFR
jgi:hypothetical protein